MWNLECPEGGLHLRSKDPENRYSGNFQNNTKMSGQKKNILGHQLRTLEKRKTFQEKRKKMKKQRDF